MATVPLSGTDIRFLSGIPFTNDYKHTRWHETIADQLNYFGAQPIVHQMPANTNFQRTDHSTYVRVDKSMDELYGCNYIMFNNYNYSRKWFYAFVTHLEYVNSKVTNVHFEIDVLQTWRFEMAVFDSFVVREHCDLWNPDGTPVINTIDEGLNYGSEYNVAQVQHYKPYNDLYFMIVVSKKAMHTGTDVDASGYSFSVNGLPQALNYYILPFYLDGSTPACNLNLTTFAGAFLVECYKSTDAVNNIVSIYISDMLPDQSPYDGTTLTLNSAYYEQATIGSAACVHAHNIVYSIGTYDAGNKYDGFSSVTESKLRMYPYTVTLLTDFRGNQIELKNEYINNTNLILDIKGSLGVSNKISYTIKDYLTSLITDDTMKDAVNMQHSLIDDNPNDLPVMADMLSAYIQGNRNSILNKKDAVLYNGVTDIIGSGVGMMASGLSGNGQGVASSAVGMAKGAGNTILQVQAMQAKIKDISNVPPSLTKMGGNSYFDYGNGFTGVWIIKKEITAEYRKKLEDFFKLYGYKKNEVKFPNFHTRQSWNYIQTKDIIIKGSFNNEDLVEIKSVFDNGITLWHTDDVQNYNLPNGVI